MNFLSSLNGSSLMLSSLTFSADTFSRLDPNLAGDFGECLSVYGNSVNARRVVY